jgi:uncharacterized small protein (DUF1192 family)
MSQFLLEGEVDHTQSFIAAVGKLKDRIAELESELEDARHEAAQAKGDAARATAKLRKQLSPLYSALKDVFGELDAIGGDTAPEPSGQQGKWEVVKQRLAPRLREAVDILLLQGTMRRTQMANALRMDYSNCTKNVIGVLIRQGWIVDNGGSLSLKQL